jgi:hypothetical protein
VLQAVHLLLSFPLFVVVVAVDPTWVLRSLEEHYARQMGGDGAGRIPAATPHAYLEKIFQIPVRVRPMDPAAYRRLVDGMAGRQVAEAPFVGPADRDIAEGDERDEPADEGFTGELRGPDQEEEERIPPEPTGEALTLESRELDYLKDLGPLVPTPRAAKRLVNVYRLIRVQLTPRERLRFVRQGDGTFPALLFFLALNARFPEEALSLFATIDGEEGDWARVRLLARPIAGGADWARLWADALPGAEPDPIAAPLERLGWRQIVHAAELAARYSLPGAGARAAKA